MSACLQHQRMLSSAQDAWRNSMDGSMKPISACLQDHDMPQPTRNTGRDVRDGLVA